MHSTRLSEPWAWEWYYMMMLISFACVCQIQFHSSYLAADPIVDFLQSNLFLFVVFLTNKSKGNTANGDKFVFFNVIVFNQMWQNNKMCSHLQEIQKVTKHWKAEANFYYFACLKWVSSPCGPLYLRALCLRWLLQLLSLINIEQHCFGGITAFACIHF